MNKKCGQNSFLLSLFVLSAVKFFIFFGEIKIEFHGDDFKATPSKLISSFRIFLLLLFYMNGYCVIALLLPGQTLLNCNLTSFLSMSHRSCTCIISHFYNYNCILIIIHSVIVLIRFG